MEFFNSDGSIRKILLRSIRLHLILSKQNIFSSTNRFLWMKNYFLKFKIGFILIDLDKILPTKASEFEISLSVESYDKKTAERKIGSIFNFLIFNTFREKCKIIFYVALQFKFKNSACGREIVALGNFFNYMKFQPNLTSD